MPFPVSEKKNAALKRAFKRLGICETDLEESFVRSGGPGGQNVNKVSTCVILKHAPSGITVRCQKERSQAMNRFTARELLAAKLDARIRSRAEAAAQKAAKIKRQKRKRSRRAKDKMLDAKKKQGQKKTLRRTVRRDD